MSIRGLQYQSLEVPFTNGLDQKRGDLFRAPPTLDICKDVEFDDVGELRLRKPYSVKANTDTVSGPRKVVAYGDELLIFGTDTLYTYNTVTSELVSRGTHLAVKVEELARFTNTADQIQCDRAELNGVVFYSWMETVSHLSTTVDVGLVAAVDKATGAIIMAPRGLSGAGAPSAAIRLRLVALSTRVLLFFLPSAASALQVWSLDPASPASAFSGAATTVLALGTMNEYYDAVRIPGTDTAAVVCRRVTTTSYTVATVTAAPVVTASTKARTCDGPIAVSAHPSGTHLQVIRANGTSIQGDYIAVSGLSDVTTGQAIGTGSIEISQIAAAHRTVQDSSQYRCYAFWSSSENPGASPGRVNYNYVDTGGTIGTAALYCNTLGIASRAFDHNGRVFVNLVFSSAAVTGASLADRAQLQDTYFLLRDDGFLVAKQVASVAGGFNSRGWLPGVAGSSGTYAWCGVERRAIILGGKRRSGYAARAPRDIVLTFDSDEARRVAKLGETLYISGGEILQFDGVELTELGFHIYPWYIVLNPSGAAGSMEDGAYTYKSTWRSDNAKAERDRSTTATALQDTVAGGPGHIDVSGIIPLPVTHKNGIAAEVWRTLKNPTNDAPFFLVTSQDPAITSNPNRYLPAPIQPSTSSIPTLSDELADADALGLEASPDDGITLEGLAPPAATILIASDTRLFLAGVAGDPDRVWYSKQRSDGEVAAFNDALVIPVPRAGGAITSLALLNETLIVFRETAIYALPGDGFDNVGGGTNYGPPRILSTDLGAVSHESVALAPMGLVFKSSKGWYLLDRGFALSYIGGPVRDYDSEDVTSVVVIEAQHQVRITSLERMLVFDYLVGQWAEWSVDGAASACIWRGAYGYLFSDGDGYFEEQSTYSAVNYGYDVETTWIKPGGSQGDVRVRWFHLLGEYLSTHHIRIRVARDYERDGSGNPSYFDDAYWTPTPTTVGGGLQFRHAPSRQNLTAIKVRVTAVSASNHANPPSGGELAKLAALSFEFGLKRPLNRRLPSAQRQ